MSRVGVMTFLHNDNYGSSLQAYALQRVIRELGHACEHIDYFPDQTEKVRNLLRSGNSPKLVLDGIRKREVKAGQTVRAELTLTPKSFELFDTETNTMRIKSGEYEILYGNSSRPANLKSLTVSMKI